MMLVKVRLSLPGKIFLLASLNLVLIGLVLTIFFRVQYRFDPQSFLIAPSHDRILSVARQIALELRDTDRATWNQILARYEEPNKIDLWLTDDDGVQLAGGPSQFPQTVAQTLERQFHAHGRDNPLLLLGTTQSPSKHWIGVRIPLPSPTGGHHDHGALIASASSLIGTPFFFDPKPWIAVVLPVICISFLCWLPFVRSLTRSVSHINRATSDIADGQFKVQLPVTRTDELGQLSSSINRLAIQLDGYVVGQRRFLGDTAHELCSPIARMQVATGILERSSDSTVITILLT
jgi:methyl-accepting chemotaxis protein